MAGSGTGVAPVTAENVAPLPQPDGRRVTGDDLRLVARVTMYHPDLWNVLALVLSRAISPSGPLSTTAKSRVLPINE